MSHPYGPTQAVTGIALPSPYIKSKKASPNTVAAEYNSNGYKLNIVKYETSQISLFPLPDIIWMIKLRRMRLAGDVACMAVMRNACKIMTGKPEVKTLL
jgi:hypothetical protein